MKVALLAFLSLCLYAQDASKDAPKHDEAKTNKAVKDGIEFVKSQLVYIDRFEFPVGNARLHPDELILWTFVYAGVPEKDSEFVELFERMAKRELSKTYEVALQAMILDELDRVKYQARIAQCAQFLVDNQCANGQWSYGEPTAAVDKLAPIKPPDKRQSVKPSSKIIITKRRDGPAEGDNSNSQFAALGIRACHDAGVVLPEKVIASAQKWWRDSQHNRLGETDTGRGWCYGPKTGCTWGGTARHKAYGAMTAGGVSSLVIYDYLLGTNWKKDQNVLEGLAWLDRNFTVKQQPGPPEIADTKPEWMYYYYLYALERAGMLFGTEKIGKHSWYAEGEAQLLKDQRSDGSWVARQSGFAHESVNAVWDTCFAILFLKRATRPPVPTVDDKK